MAEEVYYRSACSRCRTKFRGSRSVYPCPICNRWICFDCKSKSRQRIVKRPNVEYGPTDPLCLDCCAVKKDYESWSLALLKSYYQIIDQWAAAAKSKTPEFKERGESEIPQKGPDDE